MDEGMVSVYGSMVRKEILHNYLLGDENPNLRTTLTLLQFKLDQNLLGRHGFSQMLQLFRGLRQYSRRS